MVRVTNSVASNRRRKRLLKAAKGFWGDRKNHRRAAQDAVMKAMAYNYRHRKERKRDFRSLWVVRLGVAARMHGLSYSRLIDGLHKADCPLNRKMLSEIALAHPDAFAGIVAVAKEALASGVV